MMRRNNGRTIGIGQHGMCRACGGPLAETHDGDIMHPDLMGGPGPDGIGYERFLIDLPGDWSDNPGDRAEHALVIAGQVSCMWRVPAEWRVVDDTGAVVTVERRYRTK